MLVKNQILGNNIRGTLEKFVIFLEFWEGAMDYATPPPPPGGVGKKYTRRDSLLNGQNPQKIFNHRASLYLFGKQLF